jgi:hypothetical protein
MGARKYTFSAFERHTNAIRLGARKIIRKHKPSLNQAFSDFSQHIDELEKRPPSLERNVKLMLACKLLNHVYSGLILTECGLVVDAIICERSALETIAFHWLVCVDPNAAAEYETEQVPAPIKVRLRLEKHGVDVSHVRDLYSSDSAFTHVGRKAERFDSQMESPHQGELLFGGTGSIVDQDHMFEFLPHLLYLFPEPLMINSHPA